jgi:hypothetical protein
MTNVRQTYLLSTEAPSGKRLVISRWPSGCEGQLKRRGEPAKVERTGVPLLPTDPRIFPAFTVATENAGTLVRTFKVFSLSRAP